MIDYDLRAKEAANNWEDFKEYAWSDKPDDAERWTILTLESMSSSLDEQANARVFREVFANDENVLFEYYAGEGFGWINAICIRVSDDNGVTQTFKTFLDMVEKIRANRVLNESYVHEAARIATIQRIYAAGMSSIGVDVENQWPIRIYEHMWNNNREMLRLKDNEGGFPMLEDIQATWDTLNK